MRPGAWRPGRSELGALKLCSSRDGRSSGEPGCPGELGVRGIWGAGPPRSEARELAASPIAAPDEHFGESVGVLKLRSSRGFASAAPRLALVVPRLASTAAQLASAALRLCARIGGSSRVLFQSSFFFAPNRPATKEETIAVMIAPKRQDRKPPVEKGKPSCVDSQPVNLKRTEFVTIAKSPKLNR